MTVSVLHVETASTSTDIISPQAWQQVSVNVPLEAADAVANFLLELGSLGIAESERDPAKPLPTQTVIQGFFSCDISRTDITIALEKYLLNLSGHYPSLLTTTPQFTEISSTAWTDQWREHFPPLYVGARLLVIPPWESTAIAAERLAIVINPSMAFGTGHHATTRACLAAIETFCTTRGVPSRALDLGTGSGILAIALAKFGTPEVWGIDNDPIALTEAGINIAANQVRAAVTLSASSLTQLSSPFPLVVANLFATTLISLQNELRNAVSPAGTLIVSGMQADEEAEVIAAYTTPIWTLISRYPVDEWVTLVFERVVT